MRVPPSYSRSTTPFRRSKYIPAQTTSRQQKDNLNYIYILKKVCKKYAEGMQCITLTLSTYLVLQQVSLFQTNTKPLKPNFKIP